MAKARKALTAEKQTIGAKEKWDNYLFCAAVELSGPQKIAADAIVKAIDDGGDSVFWNGRATGKTFLLEQLTKCFGG